MKQVKINLTDELDFNEYRKQICFFSQKITSFRREGNSLIIECEDNANTDKIEKKANDALKKNLESKKEDIVIDEHLKKCKYHNDFYRDGFIKKNSGGFVSLEGDAVILYEFFDNEFRKIAEKLDAKEERYPILLGIDTMKDTGYYRRSPQYTMFCSDVSDDVKQCLRLFIRDILGLTPIERQEELDIISALIQEMEKGNIVISAGNLYALPYSEIHYHVDNWPHLFIYKGYNYDTKMFRILDNIHMHTTKYKDLRYSDFFLSEDTVRKLYEEQGRVYDREFGFVVFNKNEYFGVKSDRQIVLTILRQLCMPKTGFKYRQIVKLISLNEALINGSIDNRQLKDLAKKILNINKYKTVMLNELSINMMENGYDTIYINRIKELADLLYAEWSDYVTVSVSKIKRKRFDSPEAVTESIEKMEDEIVSITKGYIDFLEKDEGTDRENKKISNEIIFVEEGKIIFSITDGKTHNFWFEDKAPKYPLLKNCNDDKIFAKARILFNQESEENLYQAGIYVKSAEDKVYYMAIDNDRNCILDTIGENNRKEEFDNTNEYLIKMNLEADCLKVQFISDASTKELKMMIERLAPVEVGLMVKTWGNGGFLEVDFKESQAIISNK